MCIDDVSLVYGMNVVYTRYTFTCINIMYGFGVCLNIKHISVGGAHKCT